MWRREPSKMAEKSIITAWCPFGGSSPIPEFHSHSADVLWCLGWWSYLPAWEFQCQGWLKVLVKGFMGLCHLKANKNCTRVHFNIRFSINVFMSVHRAVWDDDTFSVMKNVYCFITCSFVNSTVTNYTLYRNILSHMDKALISCTGHGCREKYAWRWCHCPAWAATACVLRFLHVYYNLWCCLICALTVHGFLFTFLHCIH